MLIGWFSLSPRKLLVKVSMIDRRLSLTVHPTEAVDSIVAARAVDAVVDVCHVDRRAATGKEVDAAPAGTIEIWTIDRNRKIERKTTRTRSDRVRVGL